MVRYAARIPIGPFMSLREEQAKLSILNPIEMGQKSPDARGKPMLDDDPRLKAMEAYILAQRKGAQLEFGKH